MGRIGIDRGFLGRLARDVRGNTLALMAAAMMPLAGLIGGGVDMSRLYLTKTRLQQACDAGALAGRKAMAGGAWTTGTTSTNAKAEAMFTGNFVQGDYGTATMTKSFTESNGVVSGTSTVTVPMTVMRMFGMTSRSVTVNCQAKMEIPNTDVMFVMDVTGSMDCAPGVNCSSPSPTGTRKIDGLKSAVKCFYEALEKVNTTEVCGNDPTATTATTSAQIRIGFVPYSVNVNVGRLLPNSYMVDSWKYQSRTPATTPTTMYAYSIGSESSVTGWSSWSSSPSNLNNPDTYSTSQSDWTTISTSSVTINSTSYTRYPTASSSSACSALNTNNGGVGYIESSNIQTASLQSTTNNPPTYPATSQVLTYSQDDNRTATGYKYWWDTSVSTNKCRLKYDTRSYTVSRTNGQSSKPITWTAYNNAFTNWSYQRDVSFDVSGLKAGNSTWNNTVSLPVGANSYSVKLSGQSSSSTILTQTNVTSTWDGCIEERSTYQNTNGSPQNDWGTIPASALDMNIDLAPNALQSGSYWAPMLDDAVWGRYTCSGSCTASYNAVVTSSDLSHNNNYVCPTAARKLTIYDTATNLESYVDSLTANGATYHDIGMLWGARLLSPTGIFGSENAQTPSGRPIQRHLIFMTDGDTNTSDANYGAYGIGFYDRRQTSYEPSTTQMNNMTNARLVALCTAIKNMNITLWVISYGGGVNSTTETRLSNCATTGRYYSAADNAALISRFRQIANDISELRLTS